MSAGASPNHSSGRWRSGNIPKAPAHKLTDSSAASRKAGHAEPAADAAVRKSGRVSARRLEEPAETSRQTPSDSDTPRQPSRGAARGPPARKGQVKARGGASAGDDAERRGQSARQAAAAAAAALTRVSEGTETEMESDDAVQRRRAEPDRCRADERTSNRPHAEQRAKGVSAQASDGIAAAGGRQEASRPGASAGRRPGKMRFLADILGTLPSNGAVQSERGRSASDMGAQRSDPAGGAGDAVTTRSADATTAGRGKDERRENGEPISVRATAAAEPSSECWTDAQVGLAGLCVAQCTAVLVEMICTHGSRCCQGDHERLQTGGNLDVHRR